MDKLAGTFESWCDYDSLTHLLQLLLANTAEADR